MLRALFCLPLLVLFLASTAIAQEQGRKYALLVGVQKYPQDSLLTSLKFSERDMEELAKVLLAAGYAERDVRILTHTRGSEEFSRLPTAKNLRRELDLLLRDKQPEDTVLIAMAGHGVLMPVERQIDGRLVRREESLFCPVDADLRAKDLESFISLELLYDQLAACPARVKFVFCDACRNDAFAGGRPGGVSLPPPVSPPATVAALFSCAKQEVAHEAAALGGGHGVFFHYVIEGLKGEADLNRDGNITLTELAEYTQDKVRDYVAQRYGVRQMPELLGSIHRVPLVRIERDSDLTRKAETVAEFTDLKIPFCWCPPGTFKMGSPDSDTEASDGEKPQVDVTLSRGFWLGQTEVTQAQWKAVMGTEPWKGRQNVREGAAYPVTYVYWRDAVEYCRRLTERERAAGRLTGTQSYRLPSEAEWEYACRAGTATKYSFGDDVGALSDYAWWGGLIGGGNAQNEKYPHAVATKRSNPWNLQDMHGNVWEWCQDIVTSRPVGGLDPVTSSGGSFHTFRGGSWANYAKSCRSAIRSGNDPEYRGRDVGFRLALSAAGR